MLSRGVESKSLLSFNNSPSTNLQKPKYQLPLMRLLSLRKVVILISLGLFILCLVLISDDGLFKKEAVSERAIPEKNKDQKKGQQEKQQQKPQEQQERSDSPKEKGWSWRLDEAQLQKCLDLKTRTIDKYSPGRSHEKERPFPSFIPSFSPITATTDQSSDESSDSIPPKYSSNEAEAMISCLQDLNKRSLEDLQTSLSISHGDLPVRPIIPIVIICHNRDKYLRYSIQSVIANIGIEETVIVFSHDGYFPSVQKVINEVMTESRTKGLNIRYVQFFFPFSRNWLSHSFFLHLPFFEPGLARHHYYWMWNYMFDVVLPSQDVFKWPEDDMFVTTMEEDHVVTMDFYQIIKLMVEVLKPMHDKDNPVFVFSAGLMAEHSFLDPGRLDAFEYDTVQNAGLTLSRKMFLKIRNAGKAVSLKPKELSSNANKAPATTWCNFNEYNWDWAFFRMSQEFVPGTSIVPVIKRVAHIGGCGMHFKDASCDDLFRKMNDQFLQPINGHILKHPSSPLNLGLFFNHPENHTVTVQQGRKHYERPNRSIQFKIGRTSARSMALHAGFQGWLNGVISPQSKVSEMQADDMLPSDGLEWYSPFNELLCKRIETEYQ